MGQLSPKKPWSTPGKSIPVTTNRLMNGIKEVGGPGTDPGSGWAGLSGPWLREDDAGLSGLMERTAEYCGRWQGSKMLTNAANAWTGMLCWACSTK